MELPTEMESILDTHPPRRDASKHPRSVGGSTSTRQRATQVVYQFLRSSIKGGILKTGDSLHEDQLINDLNATRASVREALQSLANEGLVTRRRGRGTLVSSRPVLIKVNDIVTADGYAIEHDIIADTEMPATGLIRHRLATEHDTVRKLEVLIRARSTPVGVLVVFQVDSDAQPVQTTNMDSIAITFERVYGVPFGSMECWLDAATADERTAELLEIEPGSLLVVRDQVLTDSSGRVHEFAFAHYRADQVSFHSRS
ncbi:GntR family transcriptional regulator (plasmid) [Rhodococcus globerulus]|uniref:GntR family transcriptional regulator n=1 Tax=Rhodococcus globerulus TaxID=33008 RepID=UPI0039E7E3E7